MRITEKQLTRLLCDAEQAHAEYEKKLGQKDRNWPRWYARFIVERLGDTEE